MTPLPEIPMRVRVVDDPAREDGRAVIVEAGQVDMCQRWYLSVAEAIELMNAIREALK